MKIYYKFMSAKDFSAIEICGPFISVGSLKHLIFESKYKVKKKSGNSLASRRDPSNGSLCLGTDLDLRVTDAQTKEEYVDDSALIIAKSAVLLRRVPGDRRRRPMNTAPIVTEPLEVEKSLALGSSCSGTGSGSSVVTSVVEDGDFGEDVFALHGSKPKSLPVADMGEEDKDSKIRALANTLDKFVSNPYGSYKLPGGEFAVLKPNEDAFDREMVGLSSSSHSGLVRSIPPELHCPLCKQVMKYAVQPSRCCFDSFCDKCIRDHLVNSKLKCVCGKPNMLTDYLVPNITLRELINRILEIVSHISRGDSSTSLLRVQEIDSASHRSANANVLAPEQSAPPSMERKRASPAGGRGSSDQVAKRPRTSAGATDASADAKVQPVGRDMQSTGKEMQHKTTSSETEKKRRKMKASHQQEAEGYATQTGSYAYESYWSGMQPWMQAYVDHCVSALPYAGYGMNSFGLAYPYDQGYMVPPQGF